MKKTVIGLVVVAVAWGLLVLAMKVAYEGGYAEGRQSVEAVACEPKCTFTYRAGKLINVTCPDSTGAMP